MFCISTIHKEDLQKAYKEGTNMSNIAGNCITILKFQHPVNEKFCQTCLSWILLWSYRFAASISYRGIDNYNMHQLKKPVLYILMSLNCYYYLLVSKISITIIRILKIMEFDMRCAI